MTSRLVAALLLPAAASIAAVALFAPPVVPEPAPLSYVAVDPGDGLADPGYYPQRGGGLQVATPTLYSGVLGPSQPIEVASVEVVTGRYRFRFLIAARFSAITQDGIACHLVEQESGIALEPKLTITLARADGWSVMRSDVPMSLPAMTVAANCTTATTSFGRLEVLQATLVAEPLS